MPMSTTDGPSPSDDATAPLPIPPRTISWPHMAVANANQTGSENLKLGGSLGAVAAATLNRPEPVGQPRDAPRTLSAQAALPHRYKINLAFCLSRLAPPAKSARTLAQHTAPRADGHSDATDSCTSTLFLEDTSDGSDKPATANRRANRPSSRDTDHDGVLLPVSCLRRPPLLSRTRTRTRSSKHSDRTSTPTTPTATQHTSHGTEVTLGYHLAQNPSCRSFNLAVGLPETRVARIKNILAPHLRMDALAAKAHPAASSEIHVFVDASNIVIGFYKTLATKLGRGKSARLSPSPAFDFATLASIIERGRTVGKAVAIGSMSPHKKQRPQYFHQAEAAGYQVDVRKRIPSDVVHSKKRGRRPSGSDDAPDESLDCKSRLSTREDRVDEAIHLKMSESLLDATEPRTIVLATGDAAAAEASGGFLKFVERALRLGWCVEVVSWTNSLSSAWQNKTWRQKWGHRFAIIELDAFAIDLVATS